MAKTILGEYTLVPNGNQIDRTKVAVEAFVTPGNVSLSVALVAETIESEDEQLQPAQMAIEAALDYLRQSTSTDPHTLILESFRAANLKIYEQGRSAHTRMTCSMALALIIDDLMLYIGNLGKTRIYLYSPHVGVTQLSVEHTFMQIMTQQRQMSREKAMAHPKASTILRSLGTNDDVEADTGLYNTTSDYNSAQQRGTHGYPLQAGESIIVCSSEFYSISTSVEEPLVTEPELMRTLETHSGLAAAREILEHAIPRQPTDFIALATLQLPTRRQSSVMSRPSSQRMLIWLAALVMLIVVGLLVLLPRLSQSVQGPALTGTAAVQVAMASTNLAGTASANTSGLIGLPSLTPTQPVVGLVFANNDTDSNSNPIFQGQMIEAPGNPIRVDVSNNRVANGNAQLFIGQLGRIQIDQVNETQFSTTLFQDSDVFINSGGYQDGVILYPDGAQNISLAVSGSCMSVDYTAEMIAAACYEGTCTYRIGGSNAPDQVIPMGQQANIQNDQGSLQPIGDDEVQRYRDFLSSTNQGRDSINTCLASYAQATSEVTGTAEVTDTNTPEPTATETATNTGTRTVTPTPTPSNTLSSEQMTLEAKKSPTPTDTLTNTAVPSSNTPEPGQPHSGTPTRTSSAPSRTPTESEGQTGPTVTASTSTPVPTNSPVPTNTLVPPTNTSVPPTDTDVPPTNTPIPPTDVPPTNTPIPPTDVPPTDAPPPTAVPPTDAPPPTDVPPTDAPPPTVVPPTDAPPPTAVPPTDAPPPTTDGG